MKILVVTPWVPFPVTGADQQDRFEGFLQLQKLGHDVHVIAKIHGYQDRSAVEKFYNDAGISLELIPYVSSLPQLLAKNILRVLSEPALFDGAALEYTDPITEMAITKAVERFKPDCAWVEFTFLWPVVRLLKKLGVPSVMRSANNEAQQSIDEHGGNLFSHILAIPKFRGEKIAARESNVMLAITPVEKDWYIHCGSKHVDVLPLRGLPKTLRTHQHSEKEKLNVVFLSSSYSNGHNRDALQFLLTQVIPAVRAQAPGVFRFHITGQKFPENFRSLITDDTTVHGFIPDLCGFLDTMEIALCPSVVGQGMQQKIFEPLCCGLPLITHHTAGYPFVDGKHVLFAQDAQGYAAHLMSLRSITRRQELADEAYALAQKLFSEEALCAIAQKAIDRAVKA
jgi:glycosyltransferase involved in cell wall biosynthesis